MSLLTYKYTTTTMPGGCNCCGLGGCACSCMASAPVVQQQVFTAAQPCVTGCAQTQPLVHMIYVPAPAPTVQYITTTTQRVAGKKPTIGEEVQEEEHEEEDHAEKQKQGVDPDLLERFERELEADKAEIGTLQQRMGAMETKQAVSAEQVLEAKEEIHKVEEKAEDAEEKAEERVEKEEEKVEEKSTEMEHDVAVEEHREEQKLEKEPGPPGAPGPQGAPGPAGPEGPAAKNGSDGAPGKVIFLSPIFPSPSFLASAPSPPPRARHSSVVCALS